MISAVGKKQATMDEGVRNQVEGKFGEGKHRFSLSLMMTKLAATSCTQISLTFLVMNLEEALRRLCLRSIIRRCLTTPPLSPYYRVDESGLLIMSAQIKTKPP